MHGVAHEDRRIGGIQDYNRLTARRVADLLQAASGSFSELVDILPGAGPGAFTRDGGDDLGVLHRSNLVEGAHQRHGRLTAATHQVDVARADVLVEIDQRDDVRPDSGRG